MSEAERKKRLYYKERRKKWMFIQGVALALIALLIFTSLFIYNRLNKEIYIAYQESSSVDYSVNIPKDAPFFSDYLSEFSQYADENGDLWIPSDFAYPAMAATVIRIDMDYQLNMGAPNVDYEFEYRIYAHPEVVDSATKNKFPMPKTVIEEVTAPITQSSNNQLTISKLIEINYHDYYNMVKDFENKLGISKATENLIVTMEIEVIGSSEVFESNAENMHVITVSVPLSDQAFDINYSSSIQDGDSKILARKNSGNQHIYRGAAMTLGVIEVLLLIAFIAFIYLTKNDDVNYSIKVRRLLNNYRFFIQRVLNGFDTAGYQLLEIASFKEMLSIRDTIQSPILMSENTDQTRAQFFIPTNTKILYVFEIKVDNYDELYGNHPEWTDDSLIKLDSDCEKAVSAASTASEQPTDKKSLILADLYAEIERLRHELLSVSEQKTASVLDSSTPDTNGMKFGNITAGGNVTVNYSEMPDEKAIKDALKKLVEDISDKSDSKPEEISVTQDGEETAQSAETEKPTAEEAVEVLPANTEAAVNIEKILDELEFDEAGEIASDQAKRFHIHCTRSFSANLIQSNPETVKYYYSELKNRALSFKGVKSRMSWKYEAFKRGRDQLLRIKIRGKSVCLYCALDPEQFDKSKYFHESVDSKSFDAVPMLVKVKSPRGLKRALAFIDSTMEKFGIVTNPKAQRVDYVSEYPFQTTRELVENGLIKILSSDYVIKEPMAYDTPKEEIDAAAELSVADESEAIVDAVEDAADESEEASSDIPFSDVEFDEAGEIASDQVKRFHIHCTRSFTANLIQSDPETVKSYYSELKNYILSFKGVKARASWRYESFKKGRRQLFRIKIKGKGLRLYCALDPNDVDKGRYFQSEATAKDYRDVSTVVKIKSARGLKRSKELVDKVMSKFEILPNPKATAVDYCEIYRFRKTVDLVKDGQIKILSDSYKIKEPTSHASHKK